MPSSTTSFFRQISGREARRTPSRRWTCVNNNWVFNRSLNEMEGVNMWNGNAGGLVMRKRVMVVVDHSSCSKHAMKWALTHVTNKGDLFTLLHIVPHAHGEKVESSSSGYVVNSLGSHCKACKPEVEVEALVIQGPKLATVMNQVKKLDVSVLVLGQKTASPFFNCLCGNSSSSEEFVEQCIQNAECLTIGVSKQSRSVGGYLISTRWKKNFWLLA